MPTTGAGPANHPGATMAEWPNTCNHQLPAWMQPCYCRWSAEAEMMRRTQPQPHPINIELSNGPLTVETTEQIIARVNDALLNGTTEDYLTAMNEAEASGLAKWSQHERDWIWRSF